MPGVQDEGFRARVSLTSGYGTKIARSLPSEARLSSPQPQSRFVLQLQGVYPHVGCQGQLASE